MAKKATAKPTTAPAASKTAASAAPAKPKAAATKAVAPTAAAPACGCESKPKVTHEMVAKRAYEIWQSKGRPVGHDLENWQQAERDLGLRK